MTTALTSCPLCGGWASGAHPNYDHLHAVDRLPRQRRTDSHVIVRGWAVGMGGRLPQIWVFFEHFESAAAFGRAGRSSGYDISSYGVYEAAREALFVEHLRRDVHTLLIDFRTGSCDHPAERTDLEEWIRALDPR